eukprot:1143520-Pelagomonas_calceolata.AAC.1
MPVATCSQACPGKSRERLSDSSHTDTNSICNWKLHLDPSQLALTLCSIETQSAGSPGDNHRGL